MKIVLEAIHDVCATIRPTCGVALPEMLKKSKPVEPEPASTGVGTGPLASVGPPAIPRLVPTC